MPALKAVSGSGVNAYYNGVPLTDWSDDPRRRAARYLRAYKVGWFYKAGRKIATDIGMLRRTVSPEDGAGDNDREIIEPDVRTPWDNLDPIGQFLRLMERPNPSYTGVKLFTKTEIRLDFAGWGFWYLENGDSPSRLPTAIYGISPTRLWPSVDKESGQLIGWVMDADSPSGGVPFSVDEILAFTNATADDEDLYGQGVVEAVAANMPLSGMMSRHTADVMTTGGRLAGMIWPKARALGPDEYVDAQRSWRNVTSDPNAARRMLIFPEPMEYAAGASTPKDIGIPELANLNRDEILSAFPMWPELLGIPMPAGLNASGESRREIKRVYHEESLHPRVELLEDTIQVGLMARYEEVMGGSWDFDIEEPNLDDAGSLMEKAGAFKALVSIGFDAKEAVSAVGLDSIKWTGLPDLLDPAKQAAAAAEAAQAKQDSLQVSVTDTSRRDRTETRQPIAKSSKAAVEEQRDEVFKTIVPEAVLSFAEFLEGQRDRLIENVAKALPKNKADRQKAVKADPEWWDGGTEDEALRAVMRSLYVQIGRAGLQSVSDTLGRVMTKNMVDPIVTDLLAYGGQRITDINDTTRKAVAREVAEGVRRGYSINQIVEGVPGEQYGGVKGLSLDNGTPAFSDLRAETIARTETTLGYNRASLTGYDQFGVKHFLAYDGDDDAECASRNGAVLAYDEALAVTDHPNGTLVWSPYVEKSAHGLTSDNMLWLDASGRATPPMDLKVNLEPSFHLTPQITINEGTTTVEPAQITVQPADVHVQPVTVEAPVVNVKSPDVHVQVPDQAAPTVHVTVPEQAPPTVNVAAPTVNVKAPTVNVPPAEVKVTTEIPTVNVTIPKAPTVNVQMPESFAITSMPTRVTRRKVDRNRQGAIESTTDVEEDA